MLALEVSAPCRPTASRENTLLTCASCESVKPQCNLAQAFASLRCPSGVVLHTMPRSSRPLVCLSLVAAGYVATQLAAFVAAPAAPKAPRTQLQARGGGEYDVSDADIQAFYSSLLTGSGGDPPKGTVLSELVVKFFPRRVHAPGLQALLWTLERSAPRRHRQEGHRCGRPGPQSADGEPNVRDQGWRWLRRG